MVHHGVPGATRMQRSCVRRSTDAAASTMKVASLELRIVLLDRTSRERSSQARRKAGLVGIRIGFSCAASGGSPAWW
jgi:hypothetical protein